ncbi:hypothetical protein [Desulfurococcus mucosus]|uniref:hypothetical protein n=1 Tax=Desulfurococcus mucosus TaxID=2275 RepID=UPI00128C4D5D|nr:hypothetical protein [Desulfurococcus mucosus]
MKHVEKAASNIASCLKTGACSIRDAANALLETVLNEDGSMLPASALAALCSLKQVVERDVYIQLIEEIASRIGSARLLSSLEHVALSGLVNGDQGVDCSISLLDALSETKLTHQVHDVLEKILGKAITVENPGRRLVELVEEIIDGPFEGIPPLESAMFMEAIRRARGSTWIPVKVRTIREASVVKNPGYLLEQRYLHALISLLEDVLDDLIKNPGEGVEALYSDLNTAFTHLYKNCVTLMPHTSCSRLLSEVSGKLTALGSMVQSLHGEGDIVVR